MCAIVGVYAPDGKAALYARELLHDQQNRGQDTSGIASIVTGALLWRKGEGLVREVFGRFILPPETVRGNITSLAEVTSSNATGHNRYQTIGDGGPDNAQPFMTENDRYIITCAHNGHVNNYDTLRSELDLEQRMRADALVGGVIGNPKLERQADCDVVPIMYVFADGLEGHGDTVDAILNAATSVLQRVRGAYTVTATVFDKEEQQTYQVGFKDRYGIRPGFFGRNNGNHAIASETWALENNGFWDIKPIRNAEVIILSRQGVIRQRIPGFDCAYLPCQFEDGYFYAGLGTLNGRSVNHGRYMEGLTLGQKLLREHPDWIDRADFVAPIPSTPIPIARGVADAIHKEFRDCIEKDKYGYKREFITRAKHRHKRKVAVHWDAVTDKNIILTDDSIVRGETMRKDIADLREAGAGLIFVLSGYPRIEHRCDLGIDMRTFQELIAHGRSDEQVAKAIDADGVMYLTQEKYAQSWDSLQADRGLKRKVGLGIFSPEILEFVSKGKRCDACTTGKNPTHD